SMTNRQVCLVALCSLLILCTFIGSTQSARCCLNYIHKDKPISCKRVKDYSVQTINNSCDIDAIIFHMQGGKSRFLCADPASNFTLRVMQCIE
uniref:Chemokine interleukin-8-like domain-containing protein n=1 Tax=Salarias fasciatus TaxID=181472 RepID=A0A672GS34_SALFA